MTTVSPGLILPPITDANASSSRLKGWSPPEAHYRKGVLARYALLVGSASEGAILKP